jgi:hypothetical protein
VLDRVQKWAAQFTNHMKDSFRENLVQRRMKASLCVLFRAYTGERTWKDKRDRLRRPRYFCRVDHVRKIKGRKQRTDIGKYSFVNRIIKNWNQLPAEALGLYLVNLRFFETELGKHL